MVVERVKNIALEGSHGRPVVTDVFFKPDIGKKPVLIFCHGYKGFKDWGVWNLMAESFARNGFFFVKFNFSFNGGTLEQPIDFPDLKAFGENTFIKELDDLKTVLDWISSEDNELSEEINASNIALMGHSRGGGTVILKAAEDDRVTNLISLASVSDLAARFPQGKAFEIWKEAGIGYVENKRTKQQLPHLFSFYENFKENEDRLTISKAVRRLEKPFLIIHGTGDSTVDVDNAKDLKRWDPQAELFILEGEDHVFGAAHPWKRKDLPTSFEKIIERICNFLKN